MVPVLLGLLGVAVVAGRIADGDQLVSGAAEAGARAASVARSPAAAVAAADAAVQSALASGGGMCSQSAVNVDPGGPGGVDRVTVSCVLSLAAAPLGVELAHTVTASQTQPVDQYRAAS
jgi:Flp pilus assembly protein TadG